MWSSEFRPSDPHEVWISLRATYCAAETVPATGWNVTPYNYLTIKKWHQIIIRKWPFARSWKAASPFISQISILLCPQHLMTHMNLEGVVVIGVCAPWESLPQAGWWAPAAIFTHLSITLPCLSITTLTLFISLCESMFQFTWCGACSPQSFVPTSSIAVLSSIHVFVCPLHPFAK